MKVHLIVDFMHLYYKYKYTIESGRIRKLIADIAYPQADGTTQLVKTDVSYLYYPLKEIEGFRRQFEKEGHDVTMSICFDAITLRKNENAEYKSNRTKKLSDQDFTQIAIIRELLTRAGHNVYWVTFQYGLYASKTLNEITSIVVSNQLHKNLSATGALSQFGEIPVIIHDTDEECIHAALGDASGTTGVITSEEQIKKVIYSDESGEPQNDMIKIINIDTPYGYEADDIVANLLKRYENDFDYSVVYTNDTDLLVHINNRVGVNRYKTGSGYTAVDIHNYATYCSNEFDCNVPYNGMLLYKILCGDKSDVIKGKKGFGKKSFDKFVTYLNARVRWSELSNIDYITEVINQHKDYFGEEHLPAIMASLKMAGYYTIPEEILTYPLMKSTIELRTVAYMPMGMRSLVE